MTAFRTFFLRGNVVDLAIAVVIGASFGAVVSALVTEHHHAHIRGCRWAAGLLRSGLHDQRERRSLRAILNCGALVLDDCHHSHLRRCAAGESPAGAVLADRP